MVLLQQLQKHLALHACIMKNSSAPETACVVYDICHDRFAWRGKSCHAHRATNLDCISVVNDELGGSLAASPFGSCL